MERKPVSSEVEPEHRVALIALPVLGSRHLRRRGRQATGCAGPRVLIPSSAVRHRIPADSAAGPVYFVLYEVESGSVVDGSSVKPNESNAVAVHMAIVGPWPRAVGVSASRMSNPKAASGW